MLVTVIAMGSRGDVQPYLALSKGLIDAGYAVRLATHAAFETLVRNYNIPFFPLDDDTQEFFQSEKGRKALDAGENALLSVWSWCDILSVGQAAHIECSLHSNVLTDSCSGTGRRASI